MYGRTGIVKMLGLVLCIGLFAAFASAGETAAAKPHMMYFYNPSCRLCTKTNETVGAMEKKYDASLSHQRFNIADAQSGLDNVTYMFDLLDAMEAAADSTPTLVVFLGLLEKEGDEVIFTPHRALIEGEEINEKLDAEITDFLSKEGKGEKSLGLNSPASFFFQSSPGLSAGA